MYAVAFALRLVAAYLAGVLSGRRPWLVSGARLVGATAADGIVILPGAAPYIAPMTLETDLPAHFLSGLVMAAPDWDAVYAEQLPRVYNFFRYRLRTRRSPMT